MEGFFVILGIGLAITIIAAVWSTLHERKRTQAWQEIAQKPGMQFLGDKNDVLSRYGSMKSFRVGRSHSMKNVVSVESGDLRIVTGDFRYRTGSGKNSHTHHRTVCVLESDTVHVTHCSLRPQRKFLDAIGAMMGGQDIDFEEDPEFSSSFVLQGDDEQAVRNLFGPKIRAWFTERKGRSFHFEAHGNTIVFHLGKRLSPSEAPDMMDQALQIMKLLAGHE